MKHLYQLTIDGLTVFFDANKDTLTYDELDHVAHTIALMRQDVRNTEQEEERIAAMIVKGSK